MLAGHALDLFLGRQTRHHDDLEIGVAHHDFRAIERALHELELFVVGDGTAHAVTESALALHRQTWGRDRGTGLWRVDVIRERWDGDVWVFRRDPRIHVEAAELVLRTPDGIPYVRPEVALLFKAKSIRPKDEADFEAVLPDLDEKQRAWLADALGIVHPGHSWLERLDA